MNGHRAGKGITLCSVTRVRTTIIDAPSIKKGTNGYTAMKAHVGVDVYTGIVHGLQATTAKVHDSFVCLAARG
ncbi:ISMca7, transposase [Roseibacterium elongatum DSM 19469]|uniref:ISMca7, transposase n=1 Tax=Roseicyclus elongatus DSM 19469 TaxID=1294273 RepID=W8RX43_9RHOB|nr:transposase [Roseibacterium elongatum]AHM05784.1 ISMca7, transposase [Roseibacterium elongatum DSM 19469]